jgi:hypothetical protein
MCLSNLIGSDPLPLATALGYATDVAAALRDLHAEGRAHGHVGPEHLQVGPHGMLLRPGGSPRPADQRSDVVDFGALLYQLITGSTPPRDLSEAALPRTPRVGPGGIRNAATRLALRCLRAGSEPSVQMQLALTELRLYSLIARQSGSHPAKTNGWHTDGNSALPPRGESVPAAGRPSAQPSARVSRVAEDSRSQPSAPADAATPPRVQGYLVPPEKVLPDLPPSDLRCPKCSGLAVYPSRPCTAFERVLDTVGIPLYRCHRCPYRYISFLGIPLPKKWRFV